MIKHGYYAMHRLGGRTTVFQSMCGLLDFLDTVPGFAHGCKVYARD